ncbi:hypothetical protein BJY01DRAFT_241942 [Aspergillus pseudoustus]|uniref:ABM domain-containing protein n=1 Tax=Aspergillus pseudoustus TaxID=1810923 RepID=A0ABR4L536_9EURO
MKLVDTAKYVLACASALVAADVTFVVSLKPLPGKADAASQYMARTIDSFHNIKPPGQLELFAFVNSDGRVVGVEKYTSTKAALDWALSKTHVDALRPMGNYFDLLSAQITTDATLDVKDLFSNSILDAEA